MLREWLIYVNGRNIGLLPTSTKLRESNQLIFLNFYDNSKTSTIDVNYEEK